MFFTIELLTDSGQIAYLHTLKKIDKEKLHNHLIIFGMFELNLNL